MPEKVIIRSIISPHQRESFTQFIPLSPDMTREIGRTVKEIFDSLGGAALLKSSRDVYVKPNGIDAKAYCYTRPEVVRAVIEYWQSAGARQVYLMENSTQANYTRVVFEVNGYRDICRDTGAIPLYLDEEKTIGFEFTGRKSIYDGDPRGYDRSHCEMPVTVTEKLIRRRDENLYVNVPKLKTHSMAGVTLGIKNQWGFPVHTSRGHDHNYNLPYKLTDVLSLLRPDVTLIEGIEGTVYGHYPVTALADRCVKPFRVLIGSLNVAAADLAGAKILGLDRADVAHLDQAIKRNLTGGVTGLDDIELEGDFSTLENIDILGDKPSSGKYPADLFDFFPWDVKVLKGKELACREGCVNNPLTLLQVLFHDHNGRGGWTLVMGKGFDPDEIDEIQGRVLVAGHCAIEEVAERLVKRLGKKKVYLSGECNDLAATAEAMFHLMKVNPVSFLPRRRGAAVLAFLMARLHGSKSRVPNPLSHLIKMV
ncbi:MAG: hypothetical protein CVV44_21615 [Spirochaetae bacterium HGW-Spirochaetae-1]|nr:MAG: hypothetical protein CVV44_21615 [Spirochaetae bacterium HGW-Spirochaetae-1]